MELPWFLHSLGGEGKETSNFYWLNRCIKYNERKFGSENMSSLFGYPLLMASDILLYSASHVPHIGPERHFDWDLQLILARVIAAKFDASYYG